MTALGAEKVYVIDPRHVLSDDWSELRTDPKLSKISVSAVKWTFVKRFDSTEACLNHLAKNHFVSIVTSPHRKGHVHTFLHETDFTQHSKLAVESSEFCVSIPMFGMIESFNLGTSSGIVLYEVARQRREYQSRYSLRDRRGARETPLPIVLDAGS